MQIYLYNCYNIGLMSSRVFVMPGIFLLFIGGFFHKTPSRLASSLVSLGIFILSSGLAMYTLAKSIIRARARQCERVLQVVLDLVGKIFILLHNTNERLWRHWYCLFWICEKGTISPCHFYKMKRMRAHV